jgi:hypothetical protein
LFFVFIRKIILKNFRKIKEYNKLAKNNGLDDFDKKKFKVTKASYFGHFKHVNCFRPKKVFQIYFIPINISPFSSIFSFE